MIENFDMQVHMLCCHALDSAHVLRVPTRNSVVKKNGIAFRTTPIGLGINCGKM